MKTEIIISRAAWSALHALAFEFMVQGGKLQGVTPEAIEEAFNALNEADRIVMEDDDADAD